MTLRLRKWRHAGAEVVITLTEVVGDGDAKQLHGAVHAFVGALDASSASPAHASDEVPGNTTEHLSDLRESIARIICNRDSCEAKIDAILALGEGLGASVARADMTPPSGASDGLRKSEEGAP